MINFFFHFLLGAIVAIAMWVLRLVPSTRSASKLACWFIRIIPSFSFGMGFMNMSNRALYSVVEGYKDKKDVFDFDISGGDVLYLGVEGFVYFLIIFLIEYMSHIPSIT
jgi:ATP-binding cassette subfamily A (ABC1) protein 3